MSEQPTNQEKLFDMGALSMEDFAKGPESVREFKVGDRITRDNFLSLIMQSFAISRGRPEVQWVFFEWLESKYGFDFMTTLAAFTQSGGWNTFSEEEKKSFLVSFKKIKAHTDRWMEFEHEDEVVNELEALEPGIRPVDLNPVRLFVKVKEVQSLEEFRAKAGEYLKAINPI